MELDSANNPKELDRFSVFELGGKLFGFEILHSREVIPLPGFTPIPNGHQVFKGVFQLRGDIYPLVDLSPVFEMQSKAVQPTDMVVLVENDEAYVMGVLVDKIHSIQTYAATDLKLPQGMVPKSMGMFVSGVIQNRGQVIHVLDMDALYKSREIRAHF